MSENTCTNRLHPSIDISDLFNILRLHRKSSSLLLVCHCLKLPNCLIRIFLQNSIRILHISIAKRLYYLVSIQMMSHSIYFMISLFPIYFLVRFIFINDWTTVIALCVFTLYTPHNIINSLIYLTNYLLLLLDTHCN